MFLLNSFQAHSSVINRIRLFPNGFVVTCSDDRLVKIWSVSSTNNDWNLIQTYSSHTNIVVALEYISTCLVASGSHDWTTRIWSIFTGETILTINEGTSVRSLLLLNDWQLAMEMAE